MDETREIDIDLRKIFYMMRTKVVYILLATVFLAAAAGAFTHFFIAPTYQANAKFYVYNNPNNTVATDRVINQNDIDASGDIINTYVYLLKTDTVLDKVAQDLGYASGNEIKNYITANRIENTLVFQVIVTTTDAELSAKIANSVAKIAPDEIVKLVNAGGASVVDWAKVPTAPVGPNTKKNVMVGAMIGFIISFALFFVYELFDTTITNTRDIEREFGDIPILGTIPRLDAPEKSGYGSSGNQQNPTDNGESAETTPPLVKPSESLLESIQSAKEGNKND
ncbi:MAG: hypothetical protein K6C14_05135 [Eubacterium sp.]|nr:hypothetical protein [Eubacterium sp.]